MTVIAAATGNGRQRSPIISSGLSAQGVSGEIAEGNAVTISALSGEDFGAQGPTIKLYEDAAGGSVGSLHPANATIGSWNTVRTNKVSESQLPYGRGINYDDKDEFFPDNKYKEIFIWGYYLFSPSPDWNNGKVHWVQHQLGSGTSGEEPSFWWPSINDGPQYTIGSNNAGDGFNQDQQSWGRYGTSQNDTLADFSVPHRLMLWAKANSSWNGAGDGAFHELNENDGVLFDRDYSGRDWSADTHTVEGWGGFNLVGYSAGQSTLKANQIYCAMGTGAAARVVVTDAQSYANSTRETIFTIDSWGASSISATVREGIFDAAGLGSKYLHIFDANNDHVAGGTGRLIS